MLAASIEVVGMKRDMDMVRDIMVGLSEGKGRTSFQFNTAFDTNVSEKKQDDEKIYYHYKILRQAGFISYKENEYKGGSILSGIPELTWNGNEYLSSIESEKVWNKTKEFIRNKGLDIGKVTFDVVIGVAKTEIKKSLGIDSTI